MKCEICGTTPTQVLVCSHCAKKAAYLCDGWLCQPSMWAMKPYEKPSCIPLMNMKCTCGQKLVAQAHEHKIKVRKPPRSRLLHVIWLRGEMRSEVLKNVCAWAEQAASQLQGIIPVLWMDEGAWGANSERLTKVKVHDDVVEEQLGWMPEWQCAVGDSRSVYVVPVEWWLKRHVEGETLSSNLAEALLFEATEGVVQVASDILRILLLRRHGGIYVDAGDVGPSKKPLDLPTIYTSVGPFVCRMKAFRKIFWKPENDLIIADHRMGKVVHLLETIETAMHDYYTKPNRRQLQLDKDLGGKLEQVRSSIAEFVEALGKNFKLCTEYAELLRIGADEPSVLSGFQDENMHPKASSYFSSLEAGINNATMTPFSETVKKEYKNDSLKNNWFAVSEFFSEATAGKDFYSWKTPGLSLVEPLLGGKSKSHSGRMLLRQPSGFNPAFSGPPKRASSLRMTSVQPSPIKMVPKQKSVITISSPSKSKDEEEKDKTEEGDN